MGKARARFHEAGLHSSDSSLVSGSSMLAFASSRVGVVVYPRVASEFV